MYKVHGYLDGGIVINERMEHLFRVGDTVRFADDTYATVTEVIWCMDEPSHGGQRVNVRIETAALSALRRADSPTPSDNTTRSNTT